MRSKRTNWILQILAALAIVFAADYFFLHILFPVKKAALLEEVNRGVEESLEKLPVHLPESTPTDNPNEVPGPGTPREVQPPGTQREEIPDAIREFHKNVKTCFGDELFARNPTELMEKLQARGIASRSTPVENWHLGTNEGEQRVMLVASDRENANGKKELRLFTVDEEGLPVPKKGIAYNPSPEKIREVLSQGQILFHQKQESLMFADGRSANVEWVDDSVREMQVFLDGRTFACSNLDCRCL